MPRREVLIIKLGALGDVLRTTPLLRRLDGRVTWVTERSAFPLLAGNPRIQRLVDVSAAGIVRRRIFDRVINFDEDDRACRLAAEASARRKIGALIRAGAKTYCEASAPWFDMSLISRLGRQAADRLKARGRRCYQDYLFAACGLRFAGEEYMLPLAAGGAASRMIALERRVGRTWPAKAWSGFPELDAALRRERLETLVLRRRRDLSDYFADIDRCGVVVAGDTLAMHVGLALGKAVVALFTCTSPHEIYGYGRLEKVVGKRLKERFYKKRLRSAETTGGLPVAPVLAAVRRALIRPPR